jgi:hypothetical protein
LGDQHPPAFEARSAEWVCYLHIKVFVALRPIVARNHWSFRRRRMLARLQNGTSEASEKGEGADFALYPWIQLRSGQYHVLTVLGLRPLLPAEIKM